MRIVVKAPASHVRRVMWSQCLFAIVAAMAALSFFHSGSAASAALYGGAAALASAWWLSRSLTGCAASASATRRRLLARGAQRFVFLAAAFALGIGPLGLSAPAMLCSFAACQLPLAWALRG